MVRRGFLKSIAAAVLALPAAAPVAGLLAAPSNVYVIAPSWMHVTVTIGKLTLELDSQALALAVKRGKTTTQTLGEVVQRAAAKGRLFETLRSIGFTDVEGE